MFKPKGVPRELRHEIRKVLEDLLNGGPGSMHIVTIATEPVTRDAVNYLKDIGALDTNGRLTANGREYWDKLNAFRPWYWFRQNWFPAIVATATILTSIGGIIVRIFI